MKVIAHENRKKSKILPLKIILNIFVTEYSIMISTNFYS